MAGQDVAAFLDGLDGATRATVDGLRAVIIAAEPALVEEIKWNAPSFRLGADHRVTLGLERNGGVRLVLHRGAKPGAIDHFTFADPDRLARWPAPDRGVAIFADAAAVVAQRAALHDLIARWLDATT